MNIFKKTKKVLTILTSISLILPYLNLSMMSEVLAAESEEDKKGEVVFQDFEDQSTFDIYSSENGFGETTTEDSFSGGKSLKYTNELSENPGDSGVFIKNKESIDVSDYKYVAFWIKDPGSNGAGIEVKNSTGSGTGWEWQSGPEAVAGEWSQMYIALDDLPKKIDWADVNEVMITEYWANDYYIDRITFTNVLEKDLQVESSVDSGTYNGAQQVELTNENQADIYYTTDGTTPTTDSTKYTEAINIESDTEIKALAVKDGVSSQSQTFTYSITDEEENDEEEDNSETEVEPIEIFGDFASKEATWLQTFDYGEEAFSISPAGTAASVVNDEERGSGVLEYRVLESSSPEINNGSVEIKADRPIDVSNLNYLIFYIKDTQGENNMKLSLIDESGAETDFGAAGWREGLNTKQGEWMQYYVPIEDLSGNVDLTAITGVRVGQWNAGTYYIDSVYFDNYLFTGEPELTPAVPEASVADGYRFTDEVEVYLANRTSDNIYYTTDGTEPSTDSNLYTDPITLTDTTTIKAVSIARDVESEVATFNYIKDENVLQDVKADKKPGRYNSPFEVGLSTEEDARIYYTTDGSEPTEESDTYNNSINIDQSTILKAVAFKDGKQSNVSTFDYQLSKKPDKPTFSIEEEAHSEAIAVEIIGSQAGDIYYTTNGEEPTSESTKYKEPIKINTSTQIRAIVVEDGISSEIGEKNYKIVPRGVDADKPAGEYTNEVVVEFRGDVDNLDIYYTEDGSSPTNNGFEPTDTAIAYGGPIRVTEDTEFNVVARYPGSKYFSEIQTFNYTITEDLVAPKISPEGGTYGDRQVVNITTATRDADIYYTIDGTEPTVNSALFTDEFVVKEDTTVKAIAVKDGEVSDVVSNEYTITTQESPFLRVDGKVMRNNYGAGEVVQLKGTNVGGWLVMEEWQSPTNAPDQLTMINTLTERFGEERAWELINQFQDTWFTEADFDILKEEGVNLIRLPLTYFEMANEDGSLKDKGRERLEWFLEEAEKREIYVLIDMHGAFGSQNGKDHSGDISKPEVGDFFGNEENIQKTIRLWEEIAELAKGNPWVAGYDLLNEPGGALGTEQFEAYDRLYQAVRAVDPDHIIHMQAIWEPMHLPNPTFYNWENVVYQYHFYGWDDLNNLDYQKRFIDSKVEMVNEITNYNVPVFVGEFTFFTNTDSWDYGLSVFDEQGWSYTSWTYKVSGANSSWGMYTAPRTSNEVVDIYEDDFDTIKQKWRVTTEEGFTRNTPIADVLSKHFKGDRTADTQAPIIQGQDAKVEVGTTKSVAEIIDLYVKDDFDGVIYPIRDSKMTQDSDGKPSVSISEFDPNKLGTQEITVTATDSSGNTSEPHIFTITVVSDTEEVDKATLIELIEKAEALNLNDYTSESADNLLEALAYAHTVVDNFDATAKEVELATNQLANAIDGLVLVDDNAGDNDEDESNEENGDKDETSDNTGSGSEADGNQDTADSEVGDDSLPQTGESNTTYYLIFGLIMVVLGALLVYINKNKTKES